MHFTRKKIVQVLDSLTTLYSTQASNTKNTIRKWIIVWTFNNLPKWELAPKERLKKKHMRTLGIDVLNVLLTSCPRKSDPQLNSLQRKITISKTERSKRPKGTLPPFVMQDQLSQFKLSVTCKTDAKTNNNHIVHKNKNNNKRIVTTIRRITEATKERT